MKTEKEIKEFLNIIIKDNLPLFFVKYKNFKNISFGKFPLLSVLYLYNAKNIIKRYEKELLQINDYEVEFEPFEIYRKFKQVSNKSLRFYLTNTFITPIEMLAILNEDTKVKKIYNKQTEKSSNSNLEKIYSYHKQKVKFDENNIKISKKLLKKGQKTFFLASSTIIILFICIISAMYFLSFNSYGLGTQSSPKNIYSLSQLKSISGSNLYFNIGNDIEVNSSISISNFGGTIDGQNNTIKLNYNLTHSLFSTLHGTIKNLTIIYNNNISQNEDLSLLVNNNNGNIENVNFIIETNITNTSKNENCHFACYANNNSGTIKDCVAKVNIQSQSSNSFDNFLCVFSATNNGEISNCKIEYNSNITTKNIDVCGICTNNNSNITNCKNYANIEEISDIPDFAPLVSGICTTNNGTLTNCFNYGELTALNTSTNTSNNAIIIGGIASFNYCDITYCLNYGTVVANSSNMNIYAGGICGYTYNSNNNQDANILNCGSICHLNISNSNSNNYVFSGGITGFIVGNIKNSYSSCTFENANDKENNNYIGLIIGCTYGQQNWMNISLYFLFENVATVASESTQSVVAAYDSYYGVNSIDSINTNNQHTIYDTFEELTESEVYWHE